MPPNAFSVAASVETLKIKAEPTTATLRDKTGLNRSLMFSAEEFGLDAQSVADVIAYL